MQLLPRKINNFARRYRLFLYYFKKKSNARFEQLFKVVYFRLQLLALIGVRYGKSAFRMLKYRDVGVNVSAFTHRFRLGTETFVCRKP